MPDHKARFHAAFERLPLVAILRGVTPDWVVAVVERLVAAGVTIVEVPLNSPDPFESIARVAAIAGPELCLGAGTVLTVAEVERLRAAGGGLAVSPGSDPAVIAASVAAGLAAVPGYQTPTEAFAALSAGADALKLFPAEAATPAILRAHRAVLPRLVPVLPVGGIEDAADMARWRAAGASGFGIGSAIFKPDYALGNISSRAAALVASVRATMA